MKRLLAPAVLAFAVGALPAAQPAAEAHDFAQRPVFRAGTAQVTLNVVVRDPKGRVVTTLSQGDFEVVDAGVPRPITEFRIEESPISVALVFDVSGSMQVSGKLNGARKAADMFLASLRDGQDECAIYTFDSSLRELQPFTSNLSRLKEPLARVEPFGSTSLYDAIADVSRQVAARPGKRRAVLVFTDGVDTSSTLTAPQVSGIASSIDVPVYLLAVVPPVDHAATAAGSADSSASPSDTNLSDLARWTGGDFFVASTPAHVSIAVRQVVTELRHQYLIAFEASPRPGWHRLEVRTRKNQFDVRSRSGYWVEDEALR